MRRFHALLALGMIALSFAYADPESAETELGIYLPPSGIYKNDIVVAPKTAHSENPIEYRFNDSSAWFPLDSALNLGAFPGEERGYTISFRRKTVKGSPEIARSYLIDRKNPQSPAIEPESGDVQGQLLLKFSSKDAVYYLAGPSAHYVAYDPASPPVIEAPSGSVEILDVSAYSVDKAGNASVPVVSRYRLMPLNFVPSSPFEAPKPSVAPKVGAVDTSPVSLSYIGRELDYVVVEARSSGKEIFISVNNDAPFSETIAYSRVTLLDGAARIYLPSPRGYQKDISVHYGSMSAGLMSISSQALKVRLPPIVAEPPYLATAQEPQSLSVAGIIVVYWPDSDKVIYYSTDGSDFQRYEKPVSVATNADSFSLSWFALDASGNQTEIRTKKIDIPPVRKAPQITGVIAGKAYGVPVTLQAVGDGLVRYSISQGKTPPPVTAQSSPLGIGLSVEGQKDLKIEYTVRLVSFDQKNNPGPDRLVSFSIDRVVPAPPGISFSVFSALTDPLTISFSAEKNAKVYYSVSADNSPDFRLYETPLVILPSERGRQYFRIRCYSVNELGVRSKEVVVDNAILDPTAVYVDPQGRSKASGAPMDPVSNLSDALRLLEAHNLRTLYVRGSLVVDRALKITKDANIYGSCDELWRQNPGSKTSLDFSPVSGLTVPLIEIEGAEVAFNGMKFAFKNSTNRKIISLVSGKLKVDNCGFTVKNGLDVCLLSQQSSSVSIDNSSFEFVDSVTSRWMESSDSATSIDSSSFLCDNTVRLFEFFKGRGGALEMGDSVLEAKPQILFSGLVLDQVTVSMERNLFRFSSGINSCRFASAGKSSITSIANYFEIAWKGNVEAFIMRDGSRLEVYHTTLLNESPEFVFINSKDSSFSIANSIVSTSSAKALLLAANRIDESSYILGNCLDGFSAYLEGAASSATIDALNAAFYRINPSLYKSPVKNFSERRELTFISSGKGLRKISPQSACVDSGMVLMLDWPRFDIDHDAIPSGRARQLPDVGADEL